MKVRKVVLPVAGLGTRFLPASKCVPKEMFPVFDRPVVQYIVEEAKAAGIEEVIFVTARGKMAMEDHFDLAMGFNRLLEDRKKTDILEKMHELDDMVRVTSVRQKYPLGLGHAVWCAREAVGNEPFAVILGDELVLSETSAIGQLIEASERLKGSVIAVHQVPKSETGRYGIVDGDDIEPGLMKLKGLVEKPNPDEAPSDLAITGRYVLCPEIFDILTNTPPGAGGEIQLTDALATLARNSDTPVYSMELNGERLDAGTPLGLIKASMRYALGQDEVRGNLLAYMKSLLDEYDE